MSEKLKNAWNSLKDENLESLKKLVKIPSVSFEGFDLSTLETSARAVADLMKQSGFSEVELLRLPEHPDAPPAVFAQRIEDPALPTVLLYAHHDVQPPGRDEVWKTPPFEPVVSEGPGGLRLYGRGAADDKAGVVIHTSAVKAHLKAFGKLPVNVKAFIEGEEEVGSNHLELFLKTHRKKLDADVIILTDTSNFDCGVPAVTTALRGLVGLELELRALTKTVHSGMWGGPLPDPVQALAKILSKLSNEKGEIAIPGVVEQVRPLSAEEEKRYRALPFDEKEFRDQCGMIASAKLLGNGPSPWAQIWRLPSISVNGIQASSRQQPGNIINDAAWAKVTIRMVPGMDPEKTLELLKSFLKSNVPWGLELKFSKETAAPAWEADYTSPKAKKVFELAKTVLSQAYGKATVEMGCGGSIPFVEPFSKALGGAPAILIGVEDPYTNAHGENESLLLEDFHHSCLAEALFFEALGKQEK